MGKRTRIRTSVDGPLWFVLLPFSVHAPSRRRPLRLRGPPLAKRASHRSDGRGGGRELWLVRIVEVARRVREAHGGRQDVQGEVGRGEGGGGEVGFVIGNLNLIR
jgi:hypothetical protein